ncbi:putative short chain dehydrogenase/ reductase [Phaeosphaeria sp. MPI-PUGE-AT-0046c]|nr:putative short chain dehydrogenase/ reductase [Phaeosphaeria sp. MPI-PUGE-AT-0046c]
MISRQLSDQACKVLFTTTNDHCKKRNWVTIHPFAQARDIRAALPNEISIFLDLSPLLSTTSSDTSSARIYGASMLVGREADILPGSHDMSIFDVLEAANKFVAAQANGVPDGMPLSIYPVRQIVSNSKPIDAMSIVQWHSEPTAPVRVEPIHRRCDLFRSDRTICDFMVSHGARNIVLTSRNPTIESRWVEEHEVNPVHIEDMTCCHEKIKQTMPPIAGVANGALVLRDRATMIGYMGQMAYTAANMFMKALICQRRARGIAGSIIDVSWVFGVGYLEREMKAQISQGREQATRLMNNSGAMVMSEQDLHQLFAEAVVAGRTYSTANAEIAAKVLWAGHPRLSHFVQDIDSAKIFSVIKSDTVPVKMQLESSKSLDEMRNVLIDSFIGKLRRALMMTHENVNISTPLIDVGVDSLVAVDIRTWFAQEVGADVAVLKILGGPSIEELADEVISKLGPVLTAKETQSDSDSAPRLSQRSTHQA